ncbi:MAG: hypothetical protein U0169_08335 [Polyangiaceae bacterium]
MYGPPPGPPGTPPQGQPPHGAPPHGYPPPGAPPPKKSSSTTLVLVFVVLSVALCGVGALAAIAGLVFFRMKDTSLLPDPEAVPDPVTSPTVYAPTPLPASSKTGRSGDDGLTEHGADVPDDDDPTLGAPTAAGPSSAPANPVAPSTTPKSGPTTKWSCNATGWVRVCGFANVCSNQMVSGIGNGTDRFTASQTAKIACEGMARAKGGSTVCSVACTPK